MSVSKLSNLIIKDFREDVPKRKEVLFRKESRGYSFFEKDSMKTGYIDDLGHKILSAIDNRANCQTILQRMQTRMPQVLLAEFLIRYLNEFKKAGLIEFARKIDRKSIKSRSKEPILVAPYQVATLLTNECNLRCSHCGNENRERKENELSKKEWFDFIDECCRIGVFIFNVSGGEPFIRKDWFEILSYARKKGIEIGITSNGTLINEETVKKLKQLDIFNIHISLDGVGKVHDQFRNQKGVFARVRNSINLLRGQKIPFGITTAVSKRNLAGIDSVKDFIDKENILSWEVYSAIPIGCMDRKEALDYTETCLLAKKISNYKKELKDIAIFVGDNMGYFDRYCTQEGWKGCQAGISICAIDSEGNIKGCPIHPNCMIEGSIRERTFSEIWLDKNSFSYNRKPVKLKKHCGQCKYAKICQGGCKASMYAQRTNFEYNNYCLRFLEQQN